MLPGGVDPARARTVKCQGQAQEKGSGGGCISENSSRPARDKPCPRTGGHQPLSMGPQTINSGISLPRKTPKHYVVPRPPSPFSGLPCRSSCQWASRKDNEKVLIGMRDPFPREPTEDPSRYEISIVVVLSALRSCPQPINQPASAIETFSGFRHFPRCSSRLGKRMRGACDKHWMLHRGGILTTGQDEKNNIILSTNGDAWPDSPRLFAWDGLARIGGVCHRSVSVT